MGQGLLSLIKRYNMEQGDWLVHTFEPHPFLYEKGGMRCIDKQIGSPHSFKDLNESLELVPSIVRHSKACGGSNRKVDLYFDKNLEDNHMGNTIVEGMYTNPYLKDYREDRISFVKDPIKVDCIDVCQFILDITKKGDIEHLVIKMIVRVQNLRYLIGFWNLMFLTFLMSKYVIFIVNSTIIF